MDSPCSGCLGQAVVTSRLPCAIVESPRRHKRVPFVNIAFLRSRWIKRRQWKHKLDYYGVGFAHLATGCGIKAKDPSGLDSDRWIPHSRCAASIMRQLSRGRPRDNSAVHGASEDVPGMTYDVPGVSYPIPWTSGDCPQGVRPADGPGTTVWHRLVPSLKRLSTRRPDCWGSANHSADALWTGNGVAHSTSETGSWCPVAVREMLRRLC